MYTVYKHTTPSNKVYIGITSREPVKRWENGKGYKRNEYFYRAILKYGWENIKHEILFTGLTKEQAELKEIELIKLYNSTNSKYGYNLRKGGSVCSFNSTSIEKMRNSHLGKSLTDEQKLKISKSLKGRKTSRGMLGRTHSEMTRLKMSNAKKGATLTSDIKEKISISRKGLCLGEDNHKSKAVLNITTGEVFTTIADACKKYSLNHSNIVMVCQGKRKTTGGYGWKYVYEEVG